MLGSLGLLMMVAALGFTDGFEAQESGVFVPSQVDVLVSGSPHLRQMKAADRPPAELVWLHASRG